MKRAPGSFGPQGGQAIILLVVAMSLVLFGALGLAIDGGQMYAQRQMAQVAADAAAEAGIISIFNGTNSTSAYPFGPAITPLVCSTADRRAPCVYARDNGFGGLPVCASCAAADTVTMSFPAGVSGVILSSSSVPAFTVTVQRTLRTSLIRMAGGAATTNISAKAAAGMVGSVSPYSLYALDPVGVNALHVTGGARVALTGGGIMVNSANAVAATVEGGASVSAASFDVVGGFVNNYTTVTPTPTTGKTPGADPFASLPAPAVGACDFNNYNPGYGTWALVPGVYCGGINISNGATATFTAGVYIIKGGGINLSGGTTNTGTGVTFYLTGTNSTYASANFSNGASATFSAPTSGPYLGVIFFQDRSITSSSNAVFNGGTTMKLNGSLYFPTTNVSFSNGNTTAGFSTAIVAKQLLFDGGTSSTFQYDSTGLQTGLFSKSVALVQ